MKLAGPVFAGAILAALTLAGPAPAQLAGGGLRAEGVAGHLIPLARVIEMIRRRSPGRQLDAGLEQQGERQVYRVRWMTSDGRRIDYIVDARTGAILSRG
jgi:uncharacterized membrane protein YkoI